MRLRSLLYVPANAERFVAKAHERDADAVILDLEDAVEEGSKDAARAALATAVPQVARNGAKAYVRVNTGPRMGEDARAALAAGADGIMLPKAETAASVDALLAELGEADDGSTEILAIIEDAGGLMDARQVAAHPRVVALALGAEDFATSTGGQPIPEVLRLPKLMVHYAAKAEGKLSLGMLRSVADFNDAEGLVAAAEEAARFGFDGASCIHPKVVAVLNTAFAPSEAALTRARRIVAAAAEAAAQGTGAFMLDGEFVDLPVLTRAKAVLAKAGESA
ncbi:HpcH/HpaI aldolase/citrate lyase family protein [Maritimibacter alkaliphilus]|uniref:HpcH/HpaI aldolase/citrate lyase family protein n=1 Tax=Maritimibacter alkaliphilus TaxID=404236 RepID=UPI001C973DCA|nr:CoA ester lyase [Maritimibacter alkaliphilus]MBY6092585.1 CoA ester lyase [Maritimibacter alkaliphilus]